MIIDLFFISLLRLLPRMATNLQANIECKLVISVLSTIFLLLHLNALAFSSLFSFNDFGILGPSVCENLVCLARKERGSVC